MIVPVHNSRCRTWNGRSTGWVWIEEATVPPLQLARCMQQGTRFHSLPGRGFPNEHLLVCFRSNRKSLQLVNAPIPISLSLSSFRPIPLFPDANATSADSQQPPGINFSGPWLASLGPPIIVPVWQNIGCNKHLPIPCMGEKGNQSEPVCAGQARH
jgi:hypothetical protein